MLEIKQLDKHNFILAERLDEPKTRFIGKQEIIYTHKNLPKYYGTLHGALNGYFIHLGVEVPFISESLKLVKPSSEKQLFDKYIECEININDLL